MISPLWRPSQLFTSFDALWALKVMDPTTRPDIWEAGQIGSAAFVRYPMVRIPEYLQGGRFNHAPKRARKLLLHRRQINRLMGAVEREGMTLVPLKLYFNEKGRAKLELALARGKKVHDKRETEKKRSWERERGRLLRAQLAVTCRRPNSIMTWLRVHYGLGTYSRRDYLWMSQ
jgi:hypothetical protein